MGGGGYPPFSHSNSPLPAPPAHACAPNAFVDVQKRGLPCVPCPHALVYVGKRVPPSAPFSLCNGVQRMPSLVRGAANSVPSAMHTPCPSHTQSSQRNLM